MARRAQTLGTRYYPNPQTPSSVFLSTSPTPLLTDKFLITFGPALLGVLAGLGVALGIVNLSSRLCVFLKV
jgi:ABC-type nitrate/sulfonate/bicarbonate transport system permease component